MKLDVSVTRQPPKTFFGLFENSNDNSISKDISGLSKKYNSVITKDSEIVLPFIVLSKDYDQTTKNFTLFVGGKIEGEALTEIQLPQGFYGIMSVKPKLGFLWGKAIGEAKRYFYTVWLPQSNYESLNMEYEYHSEKSVGKRPQIDLMFAIKPR